MAVLDSLQLLRVQRPHFYFHTLLFKTRSLLSLLGGICYSKTALLEFIFENKFSVPIIATWPSLYEVKLWYKLTQDMRYLGKYCST